MTNIIVSCDFMIIIQGKSDLLFVNGLGNFYDIRNKNNLARDFIIL